MNDRFDQRINLGIIFVIIVLVGFLVFQVIRHKENTYPADFDRNFIVSCQSAGGSASRCACALETLHDMYGWSEAKNFDQGRAFPDAYLAAVSVSCR